MSKSRIEKWKEYREMILNNDNLNLSIINSDPELLELLKSINFDFSIIFDENQNKKNKSKIDNFRYNEEIKKINNTIDQILKNETMKLQNSMNDWDINSHEYDKYINDNFEDFKDETEEIQSRTSTIDLKAKKVSI